MPLVRGFVFAAVLLLLLSSPDAFAVTTVGYFPFNDGDQRVFNNPTDGALIFDNVSATSALSTNLWEDRVTQQNGDFVVDLFWLRDATTTREILGGDLHPSQVGLDPGVVYPADLVVGGPTTTSGTVTGITGATYTYSLTVESINATEGSFTGCVQLLEEVTFMIGPTVVYHAKSREWRQTGLGLVALTPDVDGAPTTVYYLLYAKVGGTIYGSKVDNMLPYFPLNAGDRGMSARDLDVNGVAGDYLDAKTGYPASFHGSIAYPLTTTRSDKAPSTDYYYIDSSNTLRWAGVHDSSTSTDSWGTPTLALAPRTIYQGQHIVSTGTFNTGGASGPYRSDVLVMQIGASVDTQAGHFGNCVALRWTIEAPTGTLVQQTDITLASGAGVVKSINYDVSVPTPTVKHVQVLAFASLGGNTYGGPGVDTTGFFPIATGARRIFAVQSGGLDDINVGTSSPINGITVFPLVTTPYGGGAPTSTHWYGNGYDRTFLFAQTNHVGARWDFSPNPIPHLMPIAFAGQKWATSGDIRDTGSKVGTFAFAASVEAIYSSITVPAGAFSPCIRLTWTLTLSPTSGSVTNIAQTWLLAGTHGPVWKNDTASVPNVLRELAYATVSGGGHIGSLPAASGDFDNSGVVDQLDADLLLRAYLGGFPAYNLACDIYPAGVPDGVIDQRDVVAFIQAWRLAHP